MKVRGEDREGGYFNIWPKDLFDHLSYFWVQFGLLSFRIFILVLYVLKNDQNDPFLYFELMLLMILKNSLLKIATKCNLFFLLLHLPPLRLLSPSSFGSSIDKSKLAPLYLLQRFRYEIWEAWSKLD